MTIKFYLLKVRLVAPAPQPRGGIWMLSREGEGEKGMAVHREIV